MSAEPVLTLRPRGLQGQAAAAELRAAHRVRAIAREEWLRCPDDDLRAEDLRDAEDDFEDALAVAQEWLVA